MFSRWYFLLLVVLLVQFVVAENQKTGPDQNTLLVQLQAPWKETDFELNLLESIAAANELLYVSSVLKLAGISNIEEEVEDLEDFEDEDLELSRKSHKDKYELLMKNIDNEETRATINFTLVNKYYSPRIESHYDHYASDVEAELSERLKTECAVDSFGNKLDTLDVWLLYNNKLYCSKDELYALQTDSRSDVQPLLFDRVIGTNEKAPLVVLYGDHKSDQFRDFFENLYESANIGKLRFVWRYLPPKTVRKNDILTGYGVDLTLKRTDYVVIDDRDVSSKISNSKKKSSKPKLDIRKDLHKIAALQELFPIDKLSLQSLGLKLTSFVKSNKQKSSYDTLVQILEDFPKYVSFLADLPRDNNEILVGDIVDSNEKLGLSKESFGLYVNGSPIHRLELDLLKLFEKIKDELDFINKLQELGFTIEQAKFLLTKFALLSAVKQTQFRNGNTIMGKNENRFKVYDYAFTKTSKRGVVFLNDLENDNSYLHFTTNSREAYLGPESYRLRPNQIPPLRENIHDLIFAVNFGNREQLRVLFTLSKVILDNGIPQQVGIIPVQGEDPLDLILAEKFYHIVATSSPQEALAFLYKYLESKSVDETQNLIDTITIPIGQEIGPEAFQDVLLRFSIDQASVIFNGVIYELTSPNWQIAMSKQLSQDIALLKLHLRNGNAEGKSLKSLLYENAGTERNLRIIPIEPSDTLYKAVDEDLIKYSTLIRKDTTEGIAGTFWLVGDLNKKICQTQLLNLLISFKKSKYDYQIRVINSGTTSAVLNKVKKSFKLDKLSSPKIDKVIELFKSEFREVSASSNNTIIKFLESKQLPLHHDFLLFNSRYFRLDIPLSKKEIELLLEYEYSQRLSLFDDILKAYPEVFHGQQIDNFSLPASVGSREDWMDLVTSVVTKSFHFDDRLFITDVSRFDFSKLNYGNCIDVNTYEVTKKIDILLIVDPLDEYSQKLATIVKSVADIPFVNTRILLQPSTEEVEDITIKRFYRGVYESSSPMFVDGKWSSNSSASFELLPGSELFTTDLDIPTRWLTTLKESPIGVDMDNIKFDNYNNKNAYGVYELRNILIEGYARNVANGNAPSGISMKLAKSGSITDTIVMSTMGYLQLSALPGIWKLFLDSGKSSKHYSLLSASSNKFEANTASLEYVDIGIFNLNGQLIFPRLRKNPGYEGVEFSNDAEADKNEGIKNAGIIQSVFKMDKPAKEADINIFTIASGHLYERFVGIMTASLRKHSHRLIKIWIIENYISSHFKRLLPYLSEKYDVEFELISYKWPNFLRKQREKQRSIWGYKILFLDVIFPQDLHKVIFVDADQVVRTDMQDLVDMNLEGAAYGFTPMCDSREEMDGFRFWKQGYWTQVLKDDLKYHISALYVVDLDKFRQIRAGDRLRSHYQKLSADPNSLSNLDQDLPNNMQRSIKIFSLPQEWLWCEAWCSDESMKTAKTIDLCNNPLTKESKLERAKRLIPEWTVYDEEVQELVVKATEEYYEKKEKESEEFKKLEEQERLREEEEEEEEDNDIDHDEL